MRTPEAILDEAASQRRGGLTEEKLYAIRLAVREAVEEACKAMCGGCRDGEELREGQEIQGHRLRHWSDGIATMHCQAEAIRDHFKKAGY